jgi:hypothetical protein
MLRAVALSALALLVAGSAVAAPATATWYTDLDAARKEAWERGVPLLVFLSRFD